MKKILSVVLCLAMLMSLLFVLPVSAVTNQDPYYFNDFENGKINMKGTGSHHKVELVEGGAFGSRYAAKVTADDRNYGSGLYKYGTTESFNFDAHKGDTVYASMLVKLVTPQAETSPGQCSLILWSNQLFDENQRSYMFMVGKFDTSNMDWQRVDFSYTFKKDFVDDATTTNDIEGIKNMEFRMNGQSKNNLASDGVSTSCEYLIDDMEIYLKKNDGSIKYTSSFETDDKMVLGSSAPKYVAEKVTTEAHTGAQSTKITVQNAEKMYNHSSNIYNNGASIKIPIENKMIVNVSAYVKLDKAFDVSSNGKIGILAYIDTDGDGVNNGYKFFEVFIPDVTNTTDWQKVSTSYTWDKGAGVLFDWGVRLANENIMPGCTTSEPGERTFYIDDMEIEVKHGGVNGYVFDFEQNSRYKLINDGTNYVPSVVTTEKHSGNQSDLITVANAPNLYNTGAGFRYDTSHIYLSVTDGDTVCVSAYVKLAQPLAETSTGKIGFLTYISPYVDFDGDGEAKNNYKFFEVKIPDVTNTTDWQKVSTTFDWKYGETKLGGWQLRFANENVLPGCTKEEPGERKFYIDDIKIDVVNENTKPVSPVITNVKETGVFKVGSTIGVKYDFEGYGAATDASIIKLMAGNGTVGDCVAKIAPGGSVTITEDMLGKTYYWEILPKTSTGYIGEKVTLLSSKPEFADIKIFNFDDGDDLDIQGAVIADNGYLGTKGLSVNGDAVEFEAVIDPGFDYAISAKVKASSLTAATFAMDNGEVDMTVTDLGNGWYNLAVEEFNYNELNGTDIASNQISTDVTISLGETADYIIDEIRIVPANVESADAITASIPANAKIFETVNAQITTQLNESVMYVFEISEDGTNWATVSKNMNSRKSASLYMDTYMVGKKLRLTAYKNGEVYQVAQSNVLTETTDRVVSTVITVTGANGTVAEDVSSGILKASAQVYNPSETATNVTLYTAVYTTVPEKLALLIPTVVTAERGVTPVSYTIDLSDVSHYSQYTHFVKTFLWDANCKPLTDAVETPADELLDGAVYNMYIDPSIETVQGIVLMNQHGECGAYAQNANFRAFCKERNLAIFDFYDGSNGQLKWFHNEEVAMSVLNTKIAEFAYTTGHPELNYAPFATLGHSNGCYAAAKIAQLNPERTFAVLAFKSAYGNQFEYDELIEAGVPVFSITGETDWSWGYHDQIHSAERMVAEGGIVTYVQQPGKGHGGITSAESIMLAFLDEAYKAKVVNATVSNGTVTLADIDVTSGYIGYGEYTEEVKSVPIAENNNRNEDRTVYVFTNPQYMTYAEYQATVATDATFKAQAWLFNESFAEKWANFINTGSIE